MMRRLLIESIKADPGYNNGDYAEQPRSMRLALAMFDIGCGGDIALQAAAPTAAAADSALVERRLGPPAATPTTRSGSSKRRMTIPGPVRISARCWRSIPPMTSATR